MSDGGGPLAVIVNGRESSNIAVQDRGLAYGDGLFETIRVSRARPELWERHWTRLAQGCSRLHMPVPDRSQIEEEAFALSARTDDGVLKIIITRGAGGRGYAPPEDTVPTRAMLLYGAPPAVPETFTLGLCYTRLAAQPALAGMKHLNRLEQVLARRELLALGTDEGVMLDTSGRVVEATQANIFAVKGNRVVTPDLSSCGVAGVMRGLVLDLLEAAGSPAAVGEMSLDDLRAGDEVFLTNCLIDVRPVVRFAAEGCERHYEPGPVAARLRATVRDAVERS